jgi:hypothetical protein
MKVLNKPIKPLNKKKKALIAAFIIISTMNIVFGRMNRVLIEANNVLNPFWRVMIAGNKG